MILILMFGGFFVTGSPSDSSSSAASAPLRYSVVSDSLSDMVVISDISATVHEGSTNVTVRFENVSDSHLSLVEVSLECVDGSGTVIQSTHPRYPDVTPGTMTTARDLIMSTDQCVEIRAEITQVEE